MSHFATKPKQADAHSSPDRILEAHARGFRHLVFDDNYVPGAGGDNFSPKAACGAREIATAFLHNSDDDASMTMWRTKGFPFPDFRFQKGVPRMTVDAYDLFKIHESFLHVVESYTELPPLWHGPNRFGIEAAQWKRTTEPPLLDAKETRRLLHKMMADDFRMKMRTTANEARAYTYFPYVRLRNKTAVAARNSSLYWPQHIAFGNYTSPFVLPSKMPFQTCQLKLSGMWAASAAAARKITMQQTAERAVALRKRAELAHKSLRGMLG